MFTILMYIRHYALRISAGIRKKNCLNASGCAGCIGIARNVTNY